MTSSRIAASSMRNCEAPSNREPEPARLAPRDEIVLRFTALALIDSDSIVLLSLFLFRFYGLVKHVETRTDTIYFKTITFGYACRGGGWLHSNRVDLGWLLLFLGVVALALDVHQRTTEDGGQLLVLLHRFFMALVLIR